MTDHNSNSLPSADGEELTWVDISARRRFAGRTTIFLSPLLVLYQSTFGVTGPIPSALWDHYCREISRIHLVNHPLVAIIGNGTNVEALRGSN